MKILIIENEERLWKEMMKSLRGNHFQCERATNEAVAYKMLENHRYDIVLLDLDLLRNESSRLIDLLVGKKQQTGIILISSNYPDVGSDIDLHSIYDQFLIKPFEIAELKICFAAVINMQILKSNKVRIIGKLLIDQKNKTIFSDNRLVALTSTEYNLLSYFVAHQNKILSKTAIAMGLTLSESASTEGFQNLYTHIKNLKKKLGSEGARIKSIYGMGYKFEG